VKRAAPLLLLLVVALAGPAGARAPGPDGPGPERVEVVVLLEDEPVAALRTLSGRAAVARERALAAAQRRVEARIRTAIPAARVRWRYRLVQNGLAVVLPARDVARLERVAGVREVVGSVRYPSLLDRGPQQIGAPALWNAPVGAARGEGIKIAIVDDGIDHTHPFLSPAGYTMPPGFPKGQRAYTTAKVIVARAFPPPSPKWKNAALPFDPGESEHGLHVAGIVAGNEGTQAESGGRVRVSGVAPRAYIGNYKALTVPTDADVGLDGNSPEIVAAIEAAVRDGMDVINLSLGQPEIEPTRDIVAAALDRAADLGVVPVVAAGNDYAEFGRGSLTSPGTTRGGTANVVASFSSAGPTPLSLRLKPDVAAPGTSILSSFPDGRWGQLSGTSMAAPHVAGAVALLLQRHPDWTVEQVKAALVGTGRPANADESRTTEAGPTRVGGGVVDLVRADAPLVFASPSSLSFGLVRPGSSLDRTVTLADAGGGAGAWTVSLQPASSATGVSVAVPPTVTVPGELTVSVTSTPAAADGEVSGWVVLGRGDERRRIPYWLRSARPGLAAVKPIPLANPGVYEATTRGRTSHATAYRYPESPSGAGVPARLAGPEQVYRVRLRRPAANFGVVVVHRDRGVRVEPRIVHAGDENRLAGYTALPLNHNPYLRGFGDLVLASGVLSPAPGAYDVVFDSPTAAGAGSFRFRFWIDDVRPPTARLVSRAVERGRPLAVRVADGQSGVDPASFTARLGELERTVRWDARRKLALVDTDGVRPGTYLLRFQVSDYQETRNMENVPKILPNTRVLTARVRIRS
jgi:subtilisin family serine protease